MLPVLLIAFNRPEHTARVVESLHLAGVREMYVSVDGPRDSADVRTIDQVTAAVESCTWLDRLEVRVSSDNQGPGWGPRNAINWFFAHVPAGIICEDDTVLAPTAVPFITEVLKGGHDLLPMVAATSLGAQAYRGPASYFASRYATTWGWATSSQAWGSYDHTMARWPELRETKWLNEIGGSRDFAQYWTNVFDMTYADRDHYWDYQWQYSMWLQGWNCWHPAVNLVTNVGFDQAATHTTEHRSGLTALPAGELEWPLVAPVSSEPNVRVDRWIDRNVYGTRRSLRGRIYRAVRGQ